MIHITDIQQLIFSDTQPAPAMHLSHHHPSRPTPLSHLSPSKTEISAAYKIGKNTMLSFAFKREM
jgi:hypothetical protein